MVHLRVRTAGPSDDRRRAESAVRAIRAAWPGTYPAGSRMPTDLDLMDETGYSRDTVRAAIKVLKDAGWITVTHGLGTYVNPPDLRTGNNDHQQQ